MKQTRSTERVQEFNELIAHFLSQNAQINVNNFRKTLCEKRRCFAIVSRKKLSIPIAIRIYGFDVHYHIRL